MDTIIQNIEFTSDKQYQNFCDLENDFLFKQLIETLQD